MKGLTRSFLVGLMVVSLVPGTALMAGKMDAPGQNKPDTIVDIAIENIDIFSALVAALTCTNLVGALDGSRQFTVFAPTDDAFGDLGLDANSVCSVPNLAGILLYHVSPGERFSGDVLASDQIRMLNKDFTYPYLDGEDPYINDAEILVPDVGASNGVIHIINKVLLP